jgi:outer membrane cobalamin receptor
MKASPIARWSRVSVGALSLAAMTALAQQQQQPPSPPSGATGGAGSASGIDLESLLDTKVTTASKFQEKLSDAAGVVTVVTQDELKRFGGTTLLEVL